MGIQDRGYFDGDSWKGDGGNSGGLSGFKQSIIAKIILINLAIFTLDMFSPRVVLEQVRLVDGKPEKVEVKSETTQQIASTLALKCNVSERNGKSGPLDNPLFAYQFLTHGFTHASIIDGGIMHVAFNMLMLFMLGIPVEEKYGKNEFLKFYLLALLFAGAVWLASKYLTGTPATAVGASGAVAAVVILFCLNFPHNNIMLMGVIPMRAWVLGILFVGMDLLTSMSSENRIAWEAHLGGAAFAAMYFYGKWGFGWVKFGWLTDRLSGKPRLKVHAPSQPQDAELSRQADIILEKVHQQGEESLSRKERKILERYSKTVRKHRDD